MHVGLNLVCLVPGEIGGMEVYARELIPRLVALRPQWRFTAFVNREAADAGDNATWRDVVPTVTVPVRARSRVGWVRGEQQFLPRLARRAGVDLVHSFASTAPAWGPFRRVVTVHDLLYRVHPEAHFGVRSLGMRVLVPLAVRRSDRVIAVSHSTARDIQQLLHVSNEKVDVVQNGVSPEVRAVPAPEGDLRAKHALGDRPVVLSVSAKRPHKNLVRLLDAIARVPSSRRPVLVVPGYPTPYERHLARRASDLGIASDVRFLSWVEAAELEGLYALAACFVYPSLYEGFGLPVLEAMARGVPVACGDRSSLPEVAGDAALTFDPERVDAIAGAITRLLDDRELAERLRQRGRARARQFTWDATARGVLDAYDRTLA